MCKLRHTSRDAKSLQDYVRFIDTYEEEGYARATYSDKTPTPTPETPKVAIPPQYADYKNIFEKKEFDKLPDRRPWDHASELSGSTPGSRRPTQT